MIAEWRIGKDLEVCGRGSIEVLCLNLPEETEETLRVAGLLAEIRTEVLPSTSVDRYCSVIPHILITIHGARFQCPFSLTEIFGYPGMKGPDRTPVPVQCPEPSNVIGSVSSPSMFQKLPIGISI
jgi:hypothetical protein